jgi:Flp pilus assembly protein TadD/O-antigen ligase
LQQWQRTIWYLIVLLTPLFVNFWVEQQFEASKVWLLRTLVWVLAVLWVGGWLFGFRPKPLPTPIRNLIITLSLILILSTLLSTNQYIAIFGSLDRANGVLTQLSYLLFFVCVATQIDSQHSQQLLVVLIFTAIPISLVGLAQAIGWQPFPVFTDARTAMTTTLGRANFTGAYLALLLPLTVVAGKVAERRWHRIGFGFLALLELFVIVLTQARAAWIAAVVGIGVLVWLRLASQWSRRMRWLTALAGFVSLGGVLLLILQRGIAAGGSIAARWVIWQASLRLLWPRLWLGYGADTLEHHFPAVYPPQLVYYQGRGIVVDRAHNWLLDGVLNYGIVATIILIALIALILWRGWQQITSKDVVEPVRLENQWVAACMAVVCAQLVGNLFLFEVAATSVVFWLMLAIVVAATMRHEQQEPQRSVAPRTGKFVLLTIVLLAGTTIWISNVRPLVADMHSWRGTQALNRGDSVMALQTYEKAAATQPRRAAYHVAVALSAAQLGRFAQAEETMDLAIALHPTDPVLQTWLAAIYALDVRVTPANKALAYGSYEQAIALAPTIALTYRQYADFALRSGDIEIALRQAQRAVDLDATDGVAFGILGWALLQSGELAVAQNAFEQAVRWQPDSADFHLGLATAHYQKNNIAEAREAVQRSLILDPTYAPALTLQLQLTNR